MFLIVWKNRYFIAIFALIAFFLAKDAIGNAAGVVIVLGFLCVSVVLGHFAKRLLFAVFATQFIAKPMEIRERVGEAIVATVLFAGLFVINEFGCLSGHASELGMADCTGTSTFYRFLILVGACSLWWVLVFLFPVESDQKELK